MLIEVDVFEDDQFSSSEEEEFIPDSTQLESNSEASADSDGEDLSIPLE